MNAHIFWKQVIVKLQRDSSVTLHVSPKTPISDGSKKITSTKIQILPCNFFPDWFGHKTIEPIRFWKSCMKHQFRLIFPRKLGFWSQKGVNIWTLFFSSISNYLALISKKSMSFFKDLLNNNADALISELNLAFLPISMEFQY